MLTRLVTSDDAAAIASLLSANRAFLSPWDPERSDAYFTVDAQRTLISTQLADFALGALVPHVIVSSSGELVGRITLNTIVRGPFQSCAVGYWVGESYGGQGLASGALASIIKVAFGELGLHRIEAATLLHNERSKRVLAKHGFVRFGLAPRYLKIAGAWQDMELFQLLNE
ncbi:GNAT family N-acetyltransferase [Tenggerimyces flavus]|uniref:GNAT family N-acetyltransferase n=1 Tax=Tenggerimyces flavus TaxID=1708749 RepID=A0ABV7Y3W6_9ACTN|nr:GNAT family protein [Tenggerimyces flavus]MBM7788521.1 ribosomal-protein-alanine N-acetyltransferase [Tenggerimyces flavus]